MMQMIIVLTFRTYDIKPKYYVYGMARSQMRQATDSLSEYLDGNTQ